MNAKEWILRIDNNPHWGRVDIDWEAINEIKALLKGPELNEMGKVALLGGLTVDDIRTIANLKRNGLMPILTAMDRHNIKPEEIGLSKLTFSEVKK